MPILIVSLGGYMDEFPHDHGQKHVCVGVMLLYETLPIIFAIFTSLYPPPPPHTFPPLHQHLVPCLPASLFVRLFVCCLPCSLGWFLSASVSRHRVHSTAARRGRGLPLRRADPRERPGAGPRRREYGGRQRLGGFFLGFQRFFHFHLLFFFFFFPRVALKGIDFTTGNMLLFLLLSLVLL